MLGEEGSQSAGTSGRRWVVDPLDGTTNFLHGIPLWSVSIALEDAQGGVAACVLAPILGECFLAERGRGCTLGGQAVTVSGVERLERALVATGFQYLPAVRARQAHVLSRVLPAVADVRRGGSAAIDLAWVACGRIDGFYEIGLSHWDSAAGALLVSEAGGEVRALDGDPAGLVAAGRGLVAELEQLVRER